MRAQPVRGQTSKPAPDRAKGAPSQCGALASPGAPVGSEGEAVAMRGDGEVRKGLGWPEVSPHDIRSVSEKHGSSDRAAFALTSPIRDSAEIYETGLGWPQGSSWPRDSDQAQVRHERSIDAEASKNSAIQPDSVSRETTAAPGPDHGDVDAGSGAGKAVRLKPGEVSAGVGGADSGARATQGRVSIRRPVDDHWRARTLPRHAVVQRWTDGNADSPIRESQAFADRRSPEEMRVWSPQVEESSRGGWTTQGPDSPMIAGTYPGTLIGRSESEDEVARSEPDTSADTPIARAVQAAMNARAGGQDWPRPESCRIVTIANQKGGVGKTTTAVNLAASLAMNGSRVLVVDLDPQGNTSTALDVEHRSGTTSVYNVLVDGTPLGDVVNAVQGYRKLFCAPATIDLAGSEIELVPLVARESRLARAFAGYDASELDYIFIDCPPSLGLLTVNALVAAPEVLIPIQCEYYALEGLEQLLRTIDLVRSHLNPSLIVSTILLTMYDSRTKLASQVADEVRSHFGDLVLGSVIPRSVRVSEAPSYGQSVMTYDPGSSGALAYLEAAREMAFRNAKAAKA